MVSQRIVRYVALVITACVAVAGCADSKGPTTRPASARERQEEALHDPFAYGADEEHPTVSGGGKKALQQDVKRLLDP